MSGVSVREIQDSVQYVDHEVIRPRENPHSQEGGIAILRGSLAPEGAVVKQSGVSQDMKIFRAKQSVLIAKKRLWKITKGKISKGSVIVSATKDQREVQG